LGQEIGELGEMAVLRDGTVRGASPRGGFKRRGRELGFRRVIRRRPGQAFAGREGESAASFRGVSGITEFAVQGDGFLDQLADDFGCDRFAFVEFECGHLVFASGSQARFDFAQALSPPESEEHSGGFSADEQDGAVGGEDEVPPLDDFVDRCRGKDCRPEGFDAFTAPAIEGG
jgi:hypothetical protein